MSASNTVSAVYLTDNKKQIAQKVLICTSNQISQINRNAFSGGGASLELHRQHGANLEVDVPYQYLTFFLEDEHKLQHIKEVSFL